MTMILHPTFENQRQATLMAAIEHAQRRASELAAFLVGANCHVDVRDRGTDISMTVKRGREAVHVYIGIEWTNGRQAMPRYHEISISYPTAIHRLRSAICAIPPVESLGQAVYDMLDRQARTHLEAA